MTHLNINHLRSHILPQHRIKAEKSLEKWTREAKRDNGRTTHLTTSRAFNLAYWQGYRDAILDLQDAIASANGEGAEGTKANGTTGTNSELRLR
jgi:hypothetical protein